MNINAAPSETSLPVQPAAQTAQRILRLQGALFALSNAAAAEFLLRSFTAPRPSGNLHLSAFGRMFLVFLALYTVHRFAYASFRLYKPDFRNLACLTLILLGSIITTWLGCVIAVSLSGYLGPTDAQLPIPPAAFYFAIPFAAGGLLLQAVLGLHYAMVFGVSLALIVGLYLPSALVLTVYVLTTTLVACLNSSRFRSRSAYLRAGFKVSLVSFPMVLCYVLIDGDFFSLASFAALVASLMGGAFCVFLASGVVPIVEHLGGYVTDVRLLEMATLDHPLLKELSVQAPGTWNHCMVMGMVVEAAADSIGANPVLARVGAYFHDIGKIKKPLYFVENQGGGDNRHDKLSTSMSALIIRTHVKDGIELCRKHKLPKAIEDMIPQHHGTSRIEYFYDKACKEAEEAGQDPSSVDESLYRYPGPKPQTREAALLMLADGIEAAARTLSDPDYDRIQGMVQKMINKVFASGELDECDLTLKDLHQIAKCFTRVLSGIYHQRIAYAEPAEKIRGTESERDEGAIQEAGAEMGGADSPKKQKVSSEEKSAKGTSADNLKRLGL